MAAKIIPSVSLLIAFVMATALTVSASDPDILTDYVVPENSTIDGNFFTFTGLRGIISRLPPTFNATKASITEFQALDGQSVAMAMLRFPGGSVNMPHTHARASELLILIGGVLEVGFVDTKNVLYTQVLRQGDISVFPKGLVHYLYNPLTIPANIISAFGSANTGTISMPKTVLLKELMIVYLHWHLKPMSAPLKRSRKG